MYARCSSLVMGLGILGLAVHSNSSIASRANGENRKKKTHQQRTKRMKDLWIGARTCFLLVSSTNYKKTSSLLGKTVNESEFPFPSVEVEVEVEAKQILSSDTLSEIPIWFMHCLNINTIALRCVHKLSSRATAKEKKQNLSSLSTISIIN